MEQRVRILLLIPHLGGGGAERVMALLACNLSAEKFDLHVCAVTQADVHGQPLPAHVAIHCLGARRVRVGALSLLRLVWRLRPSVILSCMAHLNFLVLLLRPFFPRSTRVLVRQNATVSAALAAKVQPRYTRLFYKLLYPLANLVICQSRPMAEDLAAFVHLAPERLAILPNPVDLEAFRVAASAPNSWTGPGPHLLAIGRLAPEKGFDLLLEALARLRAIYAHADLIIAGDGPAHSSLATRAERLGLQSAVRFTGYVERPGELFFGASVFVLSSRHEGMPNALLEAAAAGLPLVSTPASEGVVELLRNRPGAWLTSETSTNALAETLLTALASLQPGQRFGHNFLPPLAAAIRAYETAIDSVCANSAASCPELTQA